MACAHIEAWPARDEKAKDGTGTRRALLQMPCDRRGGYAQRRRRDRTEGESSHLAGYKTLNVSLWNRGCCRLFFRGATTTRSYCRRRRNESSTHLPRLPRSIDLVRITRISEVERPSKPQNVAGVQSGTLAHFKGAYRQAKSPRPPF